MTPNLPSVLAVLGLLLWIAAHYGLVALALRDLARRPAAAVRGGNKVAWALAVLALPIVGPLLYAAFHPGALPTASRRPPGQPRRGLPARPRLARPSTPAVTCPAGVCPPDPDPDPDPDGGVTPPGRPRPLDRTRRVG